MSSIYIKLDSGQIIATTISLELPKLEGQVRWRRVGMLGAIWRNTVSYFLYHFLHLQRWRGKFGILRIPLKQRNNSQARNTNYSRWCPPLPKFPPFNNLDRTFKILKKRTENHPSLLLKFRSFFPLKKGKTLTYPDRTVSIVPDPLGVLKKKNACAHKTAC